MCLSYHRYGVEHCTSHRVHEEELDQLIYAELLDIRDRAGRHWREIDAHISKWLSQKNDHEKLVNEFKSRIVRLENEMEKILMERIEDKENRAVYDAMVAKRREEMASLQAKIDEYSDLDKLLRKKKASLKTGVELLDEIVTAGAVSDAHLRRLIDKIIVWERKGEGKAAHLDLEIVLNAAFRIHFDEFVNGELIDRSYALQVQSLEDFQPDSPTCDLDEMPMYA